MPPQWTLCSYAPQLQGNLGHLHGYHSALFQVAKQLNINAQAFVSKAIETPSLPWIPTFTPLDSQYAKVKSWWMRYREFSLIKTILPPSPCIHFMESYTLPELASFLSAHIHRPQDHFCLFLRYGRHQLPLGGKLHEWVIQKFKRSWKNRFHLLTDSELLAKDFEAIGPLKVMPIPHAIYPKPLFIPAKQKPFLIWWPGEPREAKGLKTIQEILKNRDPIAASFELAASSQAQLIFSHSPLRFRSLSPSLSAEEYAQWLHASDLLFLPYDSNTYAKSSSGIFVEGVIAGKIPIVTPNTWMSHELKRFHLDELIFSEWTGVDFFRKILELMHNLKTLEKLKEMSQAYRSYHSVDTFALQFAKLLNG